MNPRHQAQGVPVGLQLGDPPLRLQRLVVAQAPNGPRQGRAPVPGATTWVFSWEIHGKFMGKMGKMWKMGKMEEFKVTLW